MQIAEGFDSLLHRVFTVGIIGDIGGVDDSLAAFGNDFINNCLRRRLVDIVDNDACAFSGKYSRMCSAKAAASASDDDYTVVADTH